MDRESLRSVQRPLKDRYRSEPDAALVTLRAEGALGEGLTCSVQTGSALLEAGLHPASGGRGMSACSGDMLLQALVACAGVTMNSVATSMEIPIERGTVHAEGDLDFRGTMAVSKNVPVGFTAIRVRFALESSAPPAQLDRLVELTERYCVVYQTLLNSPPVGFTLAVTREGGD
ncbi:MAG: OsmC family protein [Candidatus Dormibacteraeota bacterium]|nr:OsmC family protein [Candidatus Dormibacteraeota bacterium]